MMIFVDAAVDDADPVLLEPDNFGALKAVIANSPGSVFSTAELGQKLGRYEGEHLWVSPEQLIRLASADSARDEIWHLGFRKMLAYAEKSGWIDDCGNIRIHVEYV